MQLLLGSPGDNKLSSQERPTPLGQRFLLKLVLISLGCPISVTLKLPPCGLGQASIQQNQPNLSHMTDFQILENCQDIPVAFLGGPDPAIPQSEPPL